MRPSTTLLGGVIIFHKNMFQVTFKFFFLLLEIYKDMNIFIYYSSSNNDILSMILFESQALNIAFLILNIKYFLYFDGKITK